MAFPDNPVDNQIHEGYIYDASIGAWVEHYPVDRDRDGELIREADELFLTSKVFVEILIEIVEFNYVL